MIYLPSKLAFLLWLESPNYCCEEQLESCLERGTDAFCSWKLWGLKTGMLLYHFIYEFSFHSLDYFSFVFFFCFFITFSCLFFDLEVLSVSTFLQCIIKRVPKFIITYKSSLLHHMQSLNLLLIDDDDDAHANFFNRVVMLVDEKKFIPFKYMKEVFLNLITI